MSRLTTIRSISTFTEPDKVLSRFPRLPHSRAALGLAHAVFDSKYVSSRQRYLDSADTLRTWDPFGSSKLPATLALDSGNQDYFKKLFTEVPSAEKAWNNYTSIQDSTGFAQKLARATASLNGFRHYWIVSRLILISRHVF